MVSINRIGEIGKNSYGTSMKIIEYINANNMIVEFQDEHKFKVHCAYREFIKGKVRNPYDCSIYGVGYIGVGKYKVKEDGQITIQYYYWQSMLRRCYSDEYHMKQPTYIGCSVIDEWLNFQVFAEWFDKNYYTVRNEKMELDKDILCKGNKVYSPTTCVFVPKSINCLFTKNDVNRGEYPIGITEHFGKLEVACNNFNGKRKYLGLFNKNEVSLAFLTYKEYKESIIKEVADMFKNDIPQKLYDAMYKYKVEITD